MSESEVFRSGFVALIGRPNSGKSTLLNACLQKHIAITSPVAQTTRKRLRAVINTDHSQLVICDTPGFHKPKDALGKELNRAALAELQDVDVVALLIDATAPVGTGDEWVAKHLTHSDAYKLLVITKADLATQEQVSSQLTAAQALADFNDALVTSATENFNVDTFISLVSEHLPEGPQWYLDDMETDARDEDIVAEFVREKVLINCRQEIPHAVGVICEDLVWTAKDHVSAECKIFVERESQKGIVVGAGGTMIRRIGTQARQDIEKYLDASCYLTLEVEVRPQWRRDAHEIKRLGYDAGE